MKKGLPKAGPQIFQLLGETISRQTNQPDQHQLDRYWAH